MGLTFAVFYNEIVVRDDIPSLTPAWRQKIQSAIAEKLTVAPETFGKPLRRSLAGYRKLRVGDYRVVFRIQGNRVIIFGILHRSIVYKKTERRR